MLVLAGTVIVTVQFVMSPWVTVAWLFLVVRIWVELVVVSGHGLVLGQVVDVVGEADAMVTVDPGRVFWDILALRV